MYHPRSLHHRWEELSEQFAVLLLTGPRQVGKTTLLQHLCGSDRRYVTLDDPTLRMLAREDPDLFLQRFTAPVLIDEVQYAPELMPLIKMQVDRTHQPGMFWLTGSQQFQMMRGISETLAGRVAIVNLLGFSNRERHNTSLDVPPFIPVGQVIDKRADTAPALGLHEIFRDIWLGGFPALIAGTVTNRDIFYSSYMQTYLQRDVKDLAHVGDEASFVRFLRTCAGRTGQMVNFAELARDADVSPNTAKRWLSVLQASFLVYLLEPYHTNTTKRLVKTPKLYMLDTGLASYLTEWSSPETLEAGAASGAMLETYVLNELLKSWWHRGEKPQLYYYRDKDGNEVDFVFVKDQTLYPIQVKKSATPRKDWLIGFSALKNHGHSVAEQCVISMYDHIAPLDTRTTAMPIRMI